MADKATATVLGGFWPANGVDSLVSLSSNDGPARREIEQVLSRKGNRALRAKMRALDGVAPGATATATVAEIDGSTAELGGARTINQVSLINRATTNADVTEINAEVLSTHTGDTTFGASPPANLDGNPLGTR